MFYLKFDRISFISFVLFQSLFFSKVISQNTLPNSMWDNVSDYTFMYFPESLRKGTDFHIQTNQHFLAFDYKSLHLKDLRIINNALPEAVAVRKTLDFLPLTIDQNLLEMVLFYQGKEYKLVKGAQQPSDCRLIESGKYFQRRELINLEFEKGAPDLQTKLEIVSWPDRIIFVLKTTSPRPLRGMSLQLRLKNPNGLRTKTFNENQLLSLDQNRNGFLIHTVNNVESAMKNDVFIATKTLDYSNKNQLELVVQTIKNNQSAFGNYHGILIKANQTVPKEVELNTHYDPVYGWHQIGLRNDFLEKDDIECVKLTLNNTYETPKLIRLNFSKSITRYITGISPILRDNKQRPIGVPVQISKNWHNRTDDEFKGPWFRGFTMITIPANTIIELELTTAHGFWGSLPAASHSQLSLVGWSDRWGSNQQWDQSAIGSFGESICYEPDGGQAGTMVTDVRPLFIESTDVDLKKPDKWNWTPNVGGADFFRIYDDNGEKKFLKRLKTQYKRYCPNLTEVTYAGETSDNEADYELTTSVFRSDDMVRGIYKIKLNVNEPMEFSRFSVLQIGSDSYSYTGENKFAFGDENGLIEEWQTKWGENKYRKYGLTTSGKTPWISLHEAVNRNPETWGAWTNRGVIIRKWKAKVQGKIVDPYFSEYGTEIHKKQTSLAEINLPPGTLKLLPGDYIEAEIVHLVIPQEAKSYYGTNSAFKKVLNKYENTWKPVFLEAVGNTLNIDSEKGKVLSSYPIVVQVNERNEATVNIKGGVGYVPITFVGLTSYTDYTLVIMKEGERIHLNQEKHGNDYWQTDYDAQTKTWQITFTVPLD